VDNRVITIFRDALDLTGSARHAFVHSACAGDEALLAQVQKLLLELEAVSASTKALAKPLSAGAVLAMAEKRPHSSIQAGLVVGSFRLLRELGSGGMGAVWLAERIGEFEQLVAIKWLHAGLSQSARARFARERSLLAKLEHPGIARIVDGGSSGDSDWYAMEYVEGQTLSAQIEHNTFDLPQVLSLIIQLCDAVQFAHQNLIVHRDLKPGNVMIDIQGKAKLLDFGVAKSLSELDFTASAAPMTFAYAAPEQIKNESISTQTDVYALGVMLFELLTGSRPHKMRADSALSLLQAITDTDASAPSQLLRTQTNDQRKISARLAGRSRHHCAESTQSRARASICIRASLEGGFAAFFGARADPGETGFTRLSHRQVCSAQSCLGGLGHALDDRDFRLRLAFAT
jgi:serine/threonine-protein kinase